MFVGIGLDVVEVARFARALRRAPRLAEKLFVETERSLPLRSLAARFAAKEALAKALGGPEGLRWHDCWVINDEAGRPELKIQGSVAAALVDQGIGRLHLSLSHDGGLAVAIVAAEA
ncbi:MAG: holo-ACP synthase [Micrococcales bacterium]|nr:holo-ACP synthase [Micrococcales bacterium]